MNEGKVLHAPKNVLHHEEESYRCMPPYEAGGVLDLRVAVLEEFKIGVKKGFVE